MSAVRLLSGDEERCLLTLAQQGDEKAREALIEANQGLVIQTANRFLVKSYNADQTLDDLVQWGNLGLLRAIDRFDLARANRFAAYAVHWISAYIRRYGRTGGDVHIYERDHIRIARIQRAQEELAPVLQRPPTVSEIAQATGYQLNLIGLLLDYMDGMAAQERIDADVHELISADAPDPEEACERRMVLNQVLCAIKALPDLERAVITARYLDDPPQSYQAIARSLGRPVKEISSIEARVLKLIQNDLKK